MRNSVMARYVRSPSSISWKSWARVWSDNAVGVVSTVVMLPPLFNLRHLHHHVAHDLRLAAQPVGLVELFVRLVGSGWGEVLPSFDYFDSASAARAVAAADVADRNPDLEGDGEQRSACRDLGRFSFIEEEDARHRRGILRHDVPYRNCGRAALTR